MEAKFYVISGGVAVQTKALRFKYDVFDRRIARELDTTSPYDYADAAIERYVNDGEHVALVFDGTGALTHRVLHDPNRIDTIYADEQFDPTLPGEMPSAPGQVYWPLQDHQNTVRQMVNSSGAVVWSATYDAFGNATISNPQNIDALFTYTGRELDNDLGLYYYRARWYDPVVGRFVSEDPIGFSARTANLSEYVGNSPADATDPSGLQNYRPNTPQRGSGPWGAGGYGRGGRGPEGMRGPGTYGQGPGPSSIRSTPTPSFDLSLLTVEEYVAFVQAQQLRALQRSLRAGSVSTAANRARAAGVPEREIQDILRRSYFTPRGYRGDPTIEDLIGAIGRRVCVGPRAYGINLESLAPTETVARHIPQRPYINSPHTIRSIIESGSPRPDPGGFPGALRWDVPGSFRGSAGTFELVIDPASNRILHFMFTSGG